MIRKTPPMPAGVHEHVHPEARDTLQVVDEVELVLLIELLHLARDQDLLDEPPRLLIGHGPKRDLDQVAVMPNDRRTAGREVQIARLLIGHQTQEGVDASHQLSLRGLFRTIEANSSLLLALAYASSAETTSA